MSEMFVAGPEMTMWSSTLYSSPFPSWPAPSLFLSLSLHPSPSFPPYEWPHPTLPPLPSTVSPSLPPPSLSPLSLSLSLSLSLPPSLPPSLPLPPSLSLSLSLSLLYSDLSQLINRTTTKVNYVNDCNKTNAPFIEPAHKTLTSNYALHLCPSITNMIYEVLNMI